MSVHESHWFVFPAVDFANKVSGEVFAGLEYKLPEFGDWWVHAIVATRVLTNSSNELATGSNISMNIFDAGQGKNWWTGGNLDPTPVYPIQLIAGKGGNPGVFSEAKLVKGGSTLIPYCQQNSGGTPTGESLLYIAVFATLAQASTGNLPVLPSLGGAVSAKKGEHYKALVRTDFAANNLNPKSSKQFNLTLNRESAMIISALTTDAPLLADAQSLDPRYSEANVLINIFDTRTTWKFASPTPLPIALAFGPYAARPSVAPSFFYMAAEQNLAMEIVNNSVSVINTNYNFVLDGYLQEDVLGSRVR